MRSLVRFVSVSTHRSVRLRVFPGRNTAGTHRIFFNLPLQLCLALPPFVRVFLRAILLFEVCVLDTTPFAHYLVGQTLLPLCWRLRPERVVNDFGGCSGARELARFV